MTQVPSLVSQWFWVLQRTALLKFNTNSKVLLVVSWIINTKSSYNTVHFTFCIYVQYIQVHNTYKIRYYLHIHTHTHTSLLSFELIKHTPTSELLYLQYFTSFRSLPKYHFPRGSFSPHHSLILILLYFSS